MAEPVPNLSPQTGESLDSLLQTLCRRPADEALADVRTRLKGDPERPELLAVLGVLLAARGSLPEALDALDQAHYLRPTDAAVLYRYGEVLERAGRRRDAARRYEAALRLQPDHGGAAARLTALKAGGRRVAQPRTALGHTPAPPDAATSAPETKDEWEAEERGGFVSLLRGLVILWSVWPLAWLGIPAIPLTAAALLAPRGAAAGGEAALWWLAGLGAGLPPLVALMARHTRPPELVPAATAWIPVIPVVLAYLALVTAPFCLLLSERAPLEGWIVALTMLAGTLPVHLLSAPGLVRLCTGEAGLFRTVADAFQHASPRLWLHLAVGATATAVTAVVLTLGALGAIEATRGLGPGVTRALEVLALSLAASVGAAVLVVCAADLRPAGTPA
jgi:hypothetical protein